MTRVILTLITLATLTSCGADGAPKPPAAKPGVSISGQVQVGVVGGS